MGAGNGQTFATPGDIARLDRRLDDHEEANQQRVGELEAAEINLERNFGEVRGGLAGLRGEVNTLRLSNQTRFEGIDKQISRTNRMLELLLGERGIPVPV